MTSLEYSGSTPQRKRLLLTLATSKATAANLSIPPGGRRLTDGFVERNQYNHDVKRERGHGGSDIHDVSGCGSRIASLDNFHRPPDK